MPWYGFNYTGPRVCPQRVGAALTLEVASVPPQLAKKNAALHPIVTVSRIALRGRPRSASLRRSSKMNSIAPARLFRAASFVRPVPAPVVVEPEAALAVQATIGPEGADEEPEPLFFLN